MATAADARLCRYDEMLNILPPAIWLGKGFLVGEAWTHRKCMVTKKFTEAYATFVRAYHCYYEGDTPMTRHEFIAFDPKSI
jgi:hypothetical protein